MAIVNSDARTLIANADLTAALTYGDWIPVRGQDCADISISGTFVATAVIQRSFDGGATALTVESPTAATEKVYKAGSDCHIRVGLSAYTSGTVVTSVRYTKNY